MLNFIINAANAATLPNFSQTPDLPAFIGSVYSFALTIVGIAVLVQVIRAGFNILTAAGNTGKISEGRKMITNAVIGAVLLFASYMILFIINPDLVKNTFNFSIPKFSAPSPSSGIPSRQSTPTSGSASINGTLAPIKSTAGLFSTVHAADNFYFFTVKVVDANGDSYEKDYSIEVMPNLAQNYYSKQEFAGRFKPNPAIARAATIDTLNITTPFLADGVAGMPYFAEILAAGGQPPYVFSVSDGSLPEGLVMQPTFEMPVLTIENLTTARRPAYAFSQTDTFRLELANARPNSTVFIKWRKNGESWFYPGKTLHDDGWIDFGTTDNSGNWSNQAAFTPDQVGVWQEWIMVDGYVSNVISFEVVAPRVNIVTSSSVAPPAQAPASIPFVASCVANNYCEDPETGATSPFLSDEETVRRQDSNRCPGGRVVNECVYPDQNPADQCSDFWFEWRNCSVDLNQNRRANGTINPNGLAYSENGEPIGSAGDIYSVDRYDNDQKIEGEKLVVCRYTDQVRAIKCGVPSSGELCLPNREAGVNQTFCAR